MSLANSELLYTWAEYLALERKCVERHEYINPRGQCTANN